MLLVYLEPLLKEQEVLLTRWGTEVRYWPRTWSQAGYMTPSQATDWWMLFSREMLATQWILMYPDNTRIVRTLFD
jgi:hypothetical protein